MGETTAKPGAYATSLAKMSATICAWLTLFSDWLVSRSGSSLSALCRKHFVFGPSRLPSVCESWRVIQRYGPNLPKIEWSCLNELCNRSCEFLFPLAVSNLPMEWDRYSDLIRSRANDRRLCGHQFSACDCRQIFETLRQASESGVESRQLRRFRLAASQVRSVKKTSVCVISGFWNCVGERS